MFTTNTNYSLMRQENNFIGSNSFSNYKSLYLIRNLNTNEIPLEFTDLNLVLKFLFKFADYNVKCIRRE